jgi:hypothetical protein
MQMSVMQRKPRAGRGGKLNPDVQGKIGQQLRAMYDDVVKEGVPDRFADLLRQLEEPKDKPLDANQSAQLDQRSDKEPG